MGESLQNISYFGSDATGEEEFSQSWNKFWSQFEMCSLYGENERNKQSNNIKCNYGEASFSPEKIEDKFLYKMNFFI